jgi:flagellar biosynthesis protein FlhG
MHDQADELRQLVRQSACRPTVSGPGAPLIVVGGGKGGVGTTTTAVNLAVALARQGRRAVFVDADLDHGGNANFGQGHASGSILDVLAGRCTVHEVLERGPSGIQVIAGRWASGHVSEPSVRAHERFIAALKDLAPHADVVIIDGGSSRTQFARRLWHAADAVLVVTTSERLAIMDAYAAIKAMTGGDRPVSRHVVVNCEADATAAGDVQSRIAEACDRFLGLRAHSAGHVARCDVSNDGDGVLVYPPRCESARAMDRVADVLWANVQLVPERDATKRRARSA